MKVKIFTEITNTIIRHDLEDEINKFIKDKEVVDIKYQTNSSQDSAEIVTTFSVLIMYKED
ncbi:sporulation protein Cse60 [Lactobacillus acidophilus]|jgi:RNA-binding protein YhbY|uniref:sporulation protein Cse60 n=1 Tax=Lactobacillus acidophilus TaxID=1579 RepID=UPI000F764576|nr:sporulation protein Cse60 [Lactobacillus acidophilus]AZN76452.1 sporulation protein cse60 [Lactobacillus acidophilus]MCT3602107.1 sporulation protein Cse60 [Lactobacillus acidophilus]MCT3624420.1 sporulation protein Cse60 [Lactobacillus acidophilus]